MTEVLKHQNEERSPRPIGRFLLGLQDFSGQHDPVDFATEFARSGDNFQRHKHTSEKVSGEDVMIDGRKVAMEFEISKFAYIWRIIVYAEARATEHLRTGYQPHGGDMYELHCRSPKSSGNYVEYDGQRKVIRHKEFNDPAQLSMLQGFVEQIIQINDA